MANAWEIPGGQFSLDVAKPTDYRRFIKVNSEGLAEYATSGSDPIVGISYTDAPKEGTPISIIGYGIAMVEANVELKAGDFVTAGADGKAAKGTASQHAGVALTSVAPNDLVTVKLL